MRRKPVWLSWSSGKDAAWALKILSAGGEHEVVRLVTTINQTHGRVAMHAVRRELLQRQAQATGLPLRTIEIPHPCSNETYETAMQGAIDEMQAEGIKGFAFGDLFLEDIRAYRESRLEKTNVKAVFPLWLMPTKELAREMINAQVKAIVTCVDTRILPPGFAGREYDLAFLNDLPDEIDSCGERGEFHTFVYDAPVFDHRLNVRVGETVVRDGFAFADVLIV